MKKLFIWTAIAMHVCVVVSACGSDSDNEGGENNPPVVNYSPVGVWESGNYFLSLSNDNFCTAYVADKFIDCGTYSASDESVISCRNTYFSRTTTYAIKSLSDSQMQVDVTYTDIEGVVRSKSLTLKKTTKTPAIKDNPLVGKTCELGFSQNISAKVYYNFTTYDTASKTTTLANASKWPMTLFYIYHEGKLYFQQFNSMSGQVPQIGGWNVDAGTGEITVWTVDIKPNGSIEFGNKVTNASL